MSDDEPPEFISTTEMQRVFAGGPRLNPKWEMALVYGQIYHREPDGWHRHDMEASDGPQD